MASSASKIDLQALREKIGAIDGSLAKPKTRFSYLPQGLPLGGLVEIKGFGKTGFAVQFIKEHPDFKVAWVEEDFTLNPFALLQRDLDLQQLVFVECHKDSAWVLQQILRSQLFQAVIVSGMEFDFHQLRRLQLLNEKSQAHFLMLVEEFHQSWVPQMQVEVRSSPFRPLDVWVQRNRG